MKFEDIENIWNSQFMDESPHPDPVDFDPAVAEKRALSEAIAIEQQTTYFEIGISLIFAILGAITFFDAIVDKEPWHSYASALISFGIAVYIYMGRLHRLRDDAAYKDSLLGYLEQGIANSDYQIKRANNFVWWFLLPSLSTYILSMYFTFDGRPLWVWMFQPLAISLFYVAIRYEIYKSYQPRKKFLVSLREQLTNAEP